MSYGIIYKITNTKNGMIYIGQTTHSIRDRWRIHCSKSSTCKCLKKAISEYGKEVFVIEQVDSAESREELNRKEVEWIKKENSIIPNGYNTGKGGYQITYSYEARMKMSKHHANVRGKNNPMFGTKHSEETRKLISKRLLGKYTGKDSAFHKAVINLDTGERFDTVTAAAQAYGVSVSTLAKTCRGVQKRTAGYRWAFIEEVV